MLISIDPAEETPLFEQIAASVRSGIMDGSISAGDRMPTAKVLCASLGVNRNTVLHAYQMLRDEGLLELRRGRGATITERAGTLARLSDAVRGLVDEARALGVSADTLARLIRESYPRDLADSPMAATVPVPAPGRVSRHTEGESR
ncbi:DNA-binding transcriptional regulator YhcF (GntR family) [Actinocorallia herbida]|uniref:DNA-binding transcriptional regulator YhcF (GntR family) n=1 Tax=Actinocorallia herbida TaxID=58109 RepID=A0A3N1CWB4_9ACTN|nr:GntR family transcriptional regulator [Actinocorallia herbida]ROO85554.1 DNA-binding transcriptional regulator YhcF (GntR family) [Actinocorallia herbida]